MFDNEVKLLKRENDNQARGLDEEDESIIDQIMYSIGIFRVNSFDTQVIRRDLIGMAKEARLRNSNMKEVIGDDIKTATYEIIKNGRGYSKVEVILSYLKLLSGIAFLMLGVIGIIFNISLTWNVSLIGLGIYVQHITYYFLVSKLVQPLLNMEGWGKLGFYWSMFIALSIFGNSFVAIGSEFYYENYENARVFINSGVLLIVSGIIFLVSIYLYNRNLSKLARDRNNYIDDLRI